MSKSEYKIINGHKNLIVCFGGNGDKSIKDINNNHHILHCENIEHFKNVKIIKDIKCDLKELRDTGFIKNTIDALL